MSLWRKRNVRYSEQKPDHLVNILPNLSIQSEKAMREVQRLGQEIEIEYELKAEDDDDIQEYKRPWVGLTDEDCKGMSAGDKVVAMWADRTLKEKNT